MCSLIPLSSTSILRPTLSYTRVSEKNLRTGLGQIDRDSRISIATFKELGPEAIQDPQPLKHRAS